MLRFYGETRGAVSVNFQRATPRDAQRLLSDSRSAIRDSWSALGPAAAGGAADESGRRSGGAGIVKAASS